MRCLFETVSYCAAQATVKLITGISLSLPTPEIVGVSHHAQAFKEGQFGVFSNIELLTMKMHLPWIFQTVVSLQRKESVCMQRSQTHPFTNKNKNKTKKPQMPIN